MLRRAHVRYQSAHFSLRRPLPDLRGPVQDLRRPIQGLGIALCKRTWREMRGLGVNDDMNNRKNCKCCRGDVIRTQKPLQESVWWIYRSVGSSPWSRVSRISTSVKVNGIRANMTLWSIASPMVPFLRVDLLYAVRFLPQALKIM